MNLSLLFRSFIALSLYMAVLLAVPPASAEDQPGTRAVELTFLKSGPGQREQLKAFIQLNWFAMDEIAVAQGLMHAYTVMDTGSDEGPWNVLVSVTYRDKEGYDGIKEAFDAIRAKHTTVLVDGKTLRELGTIVDSKRLFEHPAAPTPEPKSDLGL